MAKRRKFEPTDGAGESDLARINAAAVRLNFEAADVIEYQASGRESWSERLWHCARILFRTNAQYT